jgi:hypothetical protein
MAYLNPRYNGRVGVYRTNEIERFGTAPVVYDIYAGEYFAFKFTSIDKITPHSATNQTVFIYYNTINGTISYTSNGIHIPRPGGYNYPATLNSTDYNLSAGSGGWGGLSNYFSSAKQITLFSATPFDGTWNFTVGTVGDNENDQSNLRIGNAYWYVGVWGGADFNVRTTFPVNAAGGPGGAFQTTCLVYRSGSWATVSTSAYFGFTNIGS